MLRTRFLLPLTLSALALAACAPQQRTIASASAPAANPVWAFEQSDVPVDPAWHFGRLDNGLRYAIRPNQTPKGTVLVRMQIEAGSLDEGESEQGFAHYVEHMAFNGSTRVPEGEMVKLLERDGLAFGADTNASTNFDKTTYMLDLPRNDPALLGTALMLMRETASELTFSPAAVERERGVILSEKRDRNNFGYRNYIDQAQFLFPGAHFTRRMPIGTDETLHGATAQALKAFWQREYVPAQTSVVVVGDIDPALVEAEIKARFGDWRAAATEPQPSPGPIPTRLADRQDIYVDPALSERITASRHGTWQQEPDSVTVRREHLLRQIGYAIINRRLLRLSRSGDAPFRSAGLGTSDLFKAGRSTSLSVDTVDGKWRRGLIAAGTEYRRAIQFGFTPAEIAEQVAAIRTAARNEAQSADTRPNAALLGAVMALINNDIVPDTPTRSLARLEAFIPEITPDRVMAALRFELVPLDQPLLRFQGRRAPQGGASAIAKAWAEALRAPLSPPDAKAAATFGYTQFGPAGAVISDTREPVLGIRQLRFANGVRLNLKRTELDKGKLLVQLSVDGGDMLLTGANPDATRMVSVLSQGGLGKHSKDELDTLLAGRTVSANLASTDESFIAQAVTTPADLELQLQLLAAQITDPGYRPEGEVLFRQTINNMFQALRATPASALTADQGRILSGGDPRFSLSPVEAWRKLTFAKLKQDIADRLQNGAIELGLVGDLDEDQVVAIAARTFGALPAREPEFRPWTEQRQRRFTADRSAHVLRHTGVKDQALVTMTWSTRDGEDPVAALELQLLDRVLQIELTDTLREQLGKAYSPGVQSYAGRSWRGYGTLMLRASVDVHEVAATRAAMLATLDELRSRPVPADVLLRARAPLLENYDNALKSNGGWLSFVDRAQTEADRIERFTKAKDRLNAVTPERLQELVRQYLTVTGKVEITVLPEGVEAG
ncbi:M16 family metallopeptidase [Novosphingobium sp. B 225]|uniref:M16 family metallopeptidase n=1 Tax=Novosphingobium sp. B 225 TaxID=1961849 RepID=UPI000B4BBC6A|nr:insulinase family protein [Novosphingobium sp. B 225]